MSTRHLLNMTMGAFAMLLLAAIGVVFSTTGGQGDQNPQIELAARQQVLVQDLTRQAAALSEVDDRAVLTAARQNLAQTIVLFDRNLTALLHGGTTVDANGRTVVITRTGNDMARLALEDGAQLWREIGLPLADLAAGEFSAFSAAGQKAIAGLQDNDGTLTQHMNSAANSLRMGVHARSVAAKVARWAALGLTGILIGLGLFRRKVLNAEARSHPAGPAAVPATVARDRVAEQPVRLSPREAAARQPGPSAPSDLYTSPVNFDSVNASVDQMTVDMNTIAGSTEKMRLAIDSVGNALQGMLYSLNDMAQDTAEGYKIVRNANNAASYTAGTAADLAASAREMAEVVARVTHLAQKSKQVAAQIDGEAVHTGKTGAAFTSVVAGEVNGLARQTSQATQEVEETVANILFTTRQYEEAIGQIIKNVSAINKVSQNLGDLMLSPPPRVQPGTPPPGSQPLAPAPALAAPPPEPIAPPEEPVAPAPPPVAQEDDPIPDETSADEVAAETASVIADVAEIEEPGEPEPSGSDGNVFMLGGRAKKPNALNIPQAPTPPSPPVAEADEGESNSVFMLGSVSPADPVTEPEDPAATETAPGDDQPNIYGLERPQDDSATEAADDAGDAISGDGEAADDDVLTGETGDLDPAEQALAEGEEATAPETELPLEVAEEEAVQDTEETATVPAGADDASENAIGSSANIFMLNKPK
jgi:hypothetical protein